MLDTIFPKLTVSIVHNTDLGTGVVSDEDDPPSLLLSEDDLAAGTDILAGLGGALVLASLETDHSLAGRNRLLVELANVGLGGLGAEPRAGPLGVHVSLK